MSDQSWVFKVVIMMLLAIVPIAGFNAFIDPLWTFGFSHDFNDRQNTIDERQQKTNQMTFQPFDYDGLLLGSSRSTYIHTGDFEDLDVYNFAVSNMSIQEYESFLSYAEKMNGEPFEKVFIGFDFFKSSQAEASSKRTLQGYIDIAQEPFYRYKKLLSYELFQYSKENFTASIKDEIKFIRTYTQETAAFAERVSLESTREKTMKKVEKFKSTFYSDEAYQYFSEYKQVLQNLKNNHPNTEFVAFTTPISYPLYQALIDEGRYKDYQRWLYDIASVFGGVYNFMGKNKVTTDLSNYFDGHHFYSPVGTMIINRITGEHTSNIPEDFGHYLTPEKIKTQMTS